MMITLKSGVKVKVWEKLVVEVVDHTGQFSPRQAFETKVGCVREGVVYRSFETMMDALWAEQVEANVRHHALTAPPKPMVVASKTTRAGWNAEMAAAVVGGEAAEYAVHQGWCVGSETMVVGFVPDQWGNPRRYVTGKDWLLGVYCVLINLP